MKYRFEKNNYRNFKVFRDNILTPRSYFIPYGKLDVLSASDIRYERYHSDMVACLSGEWDFKFYPHASRLPDALDTARVKFDSVRVPSTWQRTGYAKPVYLNCSYEFAPEVSGPDPVLPEDMPACIYRKEFDIGDPAGGKYILTFLGVANNAEVYVNGEYVGYSEGSHNTAEYDITDKLRAGANELVVLSFKWCTGSYLEAQDMFRENGIFRDVLLTRYDAANYIFDVAVKTQRKAKKYVLECDVNTPAYTADAKVRVELYDGDELLLGKTEHPSVNTSFVFKPVSVREWSAELPELYTLYVTLLDGDREVQSVRQYVGFKTVEIKGNVYYFNGEKIKFKGVNHHDSHPVSGYVMTHADYERDVALMKQYNVNAVRTSHYPPDPYFLTLCDMYGLYVVDEADIETHGAHDRFGDINHISHDIKWKHHYVDRVSRMYERDKNHGCVAMWSLGNESGGYKCQDACYDYLKSTGSEIPVHYEGVHGLPRVAYDVVSEMYTHIDTVETIGELKYKTRSRKKKEQYTNKPFFLCEYDHAMGFGPGSLEEYWDLFYSYDNLMGGCIWEWVDHAVFHYKDGYKFRYTYGGDHKEKRHDGNFCCDGLFYPDRTPHTGAREMKNVYRPVRADYDEEEDCYVFYNTNSFKAVSNMNVRASVIANGMLLMSGEFPLNIAPGEAVGHTIEELSYDSLTDAGVDFDNDDVFVHFEYFDGAMLVADEQITLVDNAYGCPLPDYEEDEIGVTVSGKYLTVQFENGEAVIDTESAAIVSYLKNGTEYVNTGRDGVLFRPTLSRASLDNDRNLRHFWEKEAKLYDLTVRNVQYFVELPTQNDGDNVYGAAVKFSYEICLGGKPAYDAGIMYNFAPTGDCAVRGFFLKRDGVKKLELPRFGFTLEMSSGFENVMYYGDGPFENLPDINAQCHTALFTDKVKDMHEDYIFPQENSVHCNIRVLMLNDNDGHGMQFMMGYAPFSFAVHDYTQESLHKANHPEEIEHIDATVLTLGFADRGSGSHSCGFPPLPEYLVDEEACAFSIVLMPFSDEEMSGEEEQEPFKVIR